MREYIRQSPSAFLACGVLLGFSISFVSINIAYSLLFFSAFVIILVLTVLLNSYGISHLKKTLNAVERSLDFSDHDATLSFPMPVLICNAEGTIVWYNDYFFASVLGGEELENGSVLQFTSGTTLENLSYIQMFDTDYNNKRYSVYVNHIVREADPLSVLMFADDTVLKNTADEFAASRPFVMLVSLDNSEEWSRLCTESDYQAMTNDIRRIVETWISGKGALFRRLSSGRYLIIGEERCLSQLIEDKFGVLDLTREYAYEGKQMNATLSVGVGRGDNVGACEKDAKEAMDMAQGRGGDQAVIKIGDDYQFFGGVSGALEKRSKVGVRAVSESIAYQMSQSSRVLITGHKFSDFDSLGSSFGLYALARALDIEAYIVVRRSATLGLPLMEYVEKELQNVFIEPEEAAKLIDSNTLLCLTDTHRLDFSESSALFENAQRVVIIDHHRRTVDKIDNAVIFFHEPYASSASEMVTELLSYNKAIKRIDKLTAEVLLAGIVLDTKEFVLRAGVRTFEAAAILRDSGADTVAVKKLFAGEKEESLLKNRIVASAEIFGDFALAICDSDLPNVRIACAKAADELLDLESIRASFVCYNSAGAVNISARSLGEYNVQLIMEKLGGGGHSTMAAAQPEGVTLSEAAEKLKSLLNND